MTSKLVGAKEWLKALVNGHVVEGSGPYASRFWFEDDVLYRSYKPYKHKAVVSGYKSKNLTIPIRGYILGKAKDIVKKVNYEVNFND